MFKIKLLILFFINFVLVGCVSSDIDEKQFSVKSTANDKFFLYENTLIQYLDSMGLYNDLNYDYLIKINPSKTEGVFITNIDKNSDRKRLQYQKLLCVVSIR